MTTTADDMAPELTETFRFLMERETNTTAYLIWRYLKAKQYTAALSEFYRDGDKLRIFGCSEYNEVRRALEGLAKQETRL